MEDATLGDDGSDVFCGGDVEGGVFNGDAVRSHLPAVGVGDFACVALFDRDTVACGRVEVESGPGSGDVKGDSVLFGEDGYAVGADLVGDVAVGCDAVGSDDDGLDAAFAHEMGGHVVAEDCGGDVVLHQLPGGEACTLEEGASLVGEDVDLVAAFYRCPDNSERRSIATGGESACVAVGEDGSFFREEIGAVRAHLLAGGDVVVVHAAGLGYDGGFDRWNGDGRFFGGEFVVEAANFVDSPEEIDRGGAGFGESLRDDGNFCGKGFEVGGFAAVDADGHSHCGRDADGRRAADDHVADDCGDLLVVGREDVGLLQREFGLVEEVNAGGKPFEGGNHVLISLDDAGRFVARRALIDA